MDKETLLNKHWGFATFKPLQEDIISSVMARQDTLALLPTGGGKSLCYQLPALLREGFVLVVSPLIALMEDQVHDLLKRDIKAMYFESHPKSISLSQQLDNCIHGNYKVVYVSPERLIKTLFLQQIVNAPISLIAIDEAHCISEWGHDFRPAYRKINLLRDVLPEIPLLALSASATSKVVEDIQKQLAMKSPNLFQQSFERPNLSYNLWETKDKYNAVVQILTYHKGSSIIYCKTRKQTEQLSNFLVSAGLSAGFFHGGILAEDKKTKLQAWQEGTLVNMIATSAFGMGIDKANVRTVIHMNLPESIEHYYQETGRAGRDADLAHTFLVLHEGDPQKTKNYLLNQYPIKEDIKGTYKDLCNFLQIAYGEGEGEVYDLDFEIFCTRYNRNPRKTLHCLKQFDREGIISLNTSKEKYISISTKCSVSQAKVFIQFQNTPAKVLEYLMRQNLYFFTEITRLKPHKISTSLKLSNTRLFQSLEQLQQVGMLDFTTQGTSFYYSPQTPREDQYTLNTVIDNAMILYKQKELKIEAMISYTQDKVHCKRNFILSYFGASPKGICHQCSSSSCSQLFIREPDFEQKLIVLLKKQPQSIQDLMQKLYFEPKALHYALEQLLTTQKIKINSFQQYYWIYE
jgi:ATP-dependent DNA helicase RecQ|tara:strand:- start:16941 stop:18833 length:1893 start_codon:yes stop_codon:yes gene_type:complete